MKTPAARQLDVADEAQLLGAIGSAELASAPALGADDASLLRRP